MENWVCILGYGYYTVNTSHHFRTKSLFYTNCVKNVAIKDNKHLQLSQTEPPLFKRKFQGISEADYGAKLFTEIVEQS